MYIFYTDNRHSRYFYYNVHIHTGNANIYIYLMRVNAVESKREGRKEEKVARWIPRRIHESIEMQKA